MGRRNGNTENPKAPWYLPPDSKHIAAAPYDDHIRMRRILSSGFSAGTMMQQQHLVKCNVDLLIRRLHEKARSQDAPVEIGSWFDYCTFDIIGDLLFGEPFGCLQESAMHPWISMVFTHLRIGAIGIALSRFPLLSAVSSLLLYKKTEKIKEEMMKFPREKIAKCLASGNSRQSLVQIISLAKGDLVCIYMGFVTAHLFE